jgi:hypothetical protein
MNVGRRCNTRAQGKSYKRCLNKSSFTPWSRSSRIFSISRFKDGATTYEHRLDIVIGGVRHDLLKTSANFYILPDVLTNLLQVQYLSLPETSTLSIGTQAETYNMQEILSCLDQWIMQPRSVNFFSHHS